MKFVIGIGNPGKKYDATRHNIGFAVLNRLADNRVGGSALWKEDKKFHADVAKQEGQWFLKPKTFVNHTGDCVLSLVRWHEAKPADILLVSDDVNLDFGKLRFRASGSAGGHHGLESVIALLGSDEFPRLRIGVRNERMPHELSEFVLDPFDEDERNSLDEILKNAALVCQAWIHEGFGQAQAQLGQMQIRRKDG